MTSSHTYCQVEPLSFEMRSPKFVETRIWFGRSVGRRTCCALGIAPSAIAEPDDARMTTIRQRRTPHSISCAARLTEQAWPNATDY